ncbi:MAG: alpha/beta fold hydrolase [Cyanobacteria bacterium M_surface_7_m2_040]|nr:alpha/beta fold hydrolase [Cyanobacteria bacterium K_Offshore_0m_m2_072]MBM5808812.1 alpha/beta fold hydrolase [Cyanobacteria bacterium M_surface_9_m1_291]MBM5827325.1 alpha/beta fold hydrolase [Cyanobacteria bacterium M_surface_7_m2_040]
MTVRPHHSAATAGWGSAQLWSWRGMACHWRVLGERQRPALVLLHGFGAGSGHWRRNAAPLAAAGWCVYGLDLIGFGASSQPAGRLDNRLWAQQVQAFAEQVVQAPVVLVGHSLGGLVALSCGVWWPAWVRAVVAAPLPDPSLLMPPRRPGRRRPWRRRLKRLMVRLLCRLLPLELIVPLLAHSPLLALGLQLAYSEAVIGDQELLRVIARPARRPTAVRALRAMSIAMALRPFAATARALLPRLQLPLLLIWGRDDRLVPLEVGEQCRRLRPDLSWEELERCGHCPHDERAEAFNQLLLHWLARTLG